MMAGALGGATPVPGRRNAYSPVRKEYRVQPVDVRRPHRRGAVAGYVAPAEIVGHDHDHVRLPLGRVPHGGDHETREHGSQ
jgi:hypothetical protein